MENPHADSPQLAAASTVLEAIAVCESHLETAGVFCGHGTDNAWDEAVQLVLFAVGLPADAPATVGERPLADADRAGIARLLEQRVRQRVPLPYLTGEAWFAGRRFLCDRRALVPRSPLAEVIADDYRPWFSGAAVHSLLDLCCGGGSIGISAALAAPDARVVLSDIDADALALARDNVALHAVDDRVRCVQGSLFEGLAGERFDVILCNPPYVDAEDLSSMPAEYCHEPPIGLGAGDDGLEIAHEVLTRAAGFLTRDGVLFLEVGNSWEALDAAYPELPIVWLSLASGGHGVAAISAQALREHAAGLAYTHTPTA
jgi:ribosomal protein L3 glutamine methyltransferase